MPSRGTLRVCAAASPAEDEPLQRELRRRAAIEIPVWPFPRLPRRIVRLSAHLSNELAEYRVLARELAAALAAEWAR